MGVRPTAVQIDSFRVGASTTLPLLGYYGFTMKSFNALATDLPWYNCFSWVSANPAICKVDGSGKITGKAAGTTIITLYNSGLKHGFQVTVSR